MMNPSFYLYSHVKHLSCMAVSSIFLRNPNIISNNQKPKLRLAIRNQNLD